MTDPSASSGSDKQIGDFHKANLESLPPDLRKRMVEFLRKRISPGTQAEIRDAIAADPVMWWGVHHFGLGVTVCNLLRSNGMGESETGLDNLESYYVPLLEEAVRK